jgi:elongation factor 1-beta
MKNAACSADLTGALSVALRGPESLRVGRKSLARVLASIKIFPNDANIDLEALKSRIQSSLPAGSTIQKFEEEPVAFGLVALIAYVIMPEDAAGQMDQVEEAIRSVDQVSEIEVLRVGRV